MTEKRYEHFTSKGKEFTKWFPFDGADRPKWQLKNILRNEYRTKDN